MRKARSCLSRRKRGEVGVVCLVRKQRSEKSRLGSAEMIAALISFRRNGYGTLQELHRSSECRKLDNPACTDYNAMPWARLRTKTVWWWQKLNRLFLANEHTNRGSLESIFLAELVLEKAEVGGGDIVRMTDK